MIQFDAEITTDVMTFRRAQREVQLTGRGGTNFGPVLAYLEEHRDYDGLIVYTLWLCPLPRTAPESADSHSVVVCERGALPELLSQSTASGTRGLS
ncbi:MAG: hypothetical protein GDA56_25470 [Hormoscilla sp. GM7CHS1pb]|nr:hypothetical protein [Hormoscilla sp. GM7CHS1pb]